MACHDRMLRDTTEDHETDEDERRDQEDAARDGRESARHEEQADSGHPESETVKERAAPRSQSPTTTTNKVSIDQ